jgi:exodeoxyribonuclease VII small subunit
MPSFEESLKKLESIVVQLEQGVPAACKKELEEAEGKVQVLIKQRDGSLKTQPFPAEK